MEQALSNTPAPDNVHTSNKLLTNLILTADKHHIPKRQVKTRNSILPAPIRDLLKRKNNLRRTKPTDPNLKQLNDDITKRISDHKMNLWKDKLEQNWDQPQSEHSHLLEHTEQTQLQEITRTNQQKHLLQQQTSQNIHTELKRL